MSEVEQSSSGKVDPLTARRAALLKSLEVQPPDIECPPLYLFSTLISTFVVLALPAVYLGMVIFAAWFTVKFFLLASVNTLAILPGAIGLLLLLFMVKPLFFGRRSQFEPIPLSRDEEPFLFQYVEKLSELVGAPEPSEIHVNLDVNAAASFSSGWRGFFRDELTLTLGLPLVAGMSVQQLTGVISHELGHFTQDTGMRLWFLINSINRWLQRVVFERDVFDERLHAMAASGFVPVSLVARLIQWMIWAVRRILWMLLVIGEWGCCFGARQGEFHADQFQAHMAGSRSFASTSSSVVLLDCGSNAAWRDVGTAWDDRRLGDNFPAIVVSQTRQIPKSRRGQLLKLFLTQRQNWFDTHPSMWERIQAAHEMNAPGVVKEPGSPQILFTDFVKVCRDATLETYRVRLGDEFDGAKLVSSQQLIKEQQAIRDAYDSLRRYFQGALLISRPLFPVEKTVRATENAQTILNQLKLGREKMVWAGQHATDALQRYDATCDRLLDARHALALVNAGFNIDAASFGLTSGESAKVAAAVHRLATQKEEVLNELKEFDNYARTRLTRALQLLHTSALKKRMGVESADKMARRTDQLLSVSRQLYSLLDEVEVIQLSSYLMFNLLDANVGPSSPKLVERTLKESRRLANAIGVIHQSLRNVVYPFPHADGRISAARFVVPKQPDSEHPVETARVATEVLERFHSLLARVLANFTLIAERVESAVGFSPQKEPEQTDELTAILAQQEKESEHSQRFLSRVSATVPWLLQLGTTLLLLLFVTFGTWGSFQLLSMLNSWTEAGRQVVKSGSSKRREVRAMPPVSSAQQTPTAPPVMPDVPMPGSPDQSTRIPDLPSIREGRPPNLPPTPMPTTGGRRPSERHPRLGGDESVLRREPPPAGPVGSAFESEDNEPAAGNAKSDDDVRERLAATLAAERNNFDDIKRDLKTLSPQQQVAFLREQIPHADSFDRSDMVEFLGECDDDSAVDALFDYLDERRLRSSAADGLAKQAKQGREDMILDRIAPMMSTNRIETMLVLGRINTERSREMMRGSRPGRSLNDRMQRRNRPNFPERRRPGSR